MHAYLRYYNGVREVWLWLIVNGGNDMKRPFRLVKRNGSGCVWYCFRENLRCSGYVPVFSLDGFKAVVDIGLYDIFEC